MRVRHRLTRLKAALIGTPSIRPGRAALVAYLAVFLGIVYLGWAGVVRVFRTPPAGASMARAMALIPGGKLSFREALDVTWEREMRVAETLPRTRLNLLVPRTPAALCPPVESAAEAEAQRSLTTELETALERRNDDPQAARAALEALRNAPPHGSRAASVLHSYNMARAHLILGDTATAARLLLPYFADDTVRARRDALADEAPVLAYHARLLAGIASYPQADSVAVVQFRGAVRTLQRLAPPAYAGTGREGTYHAFAVPLGSYACGTEPDSTASMEAWVGLVRAYRQAERFNDTYNLPAELERPRGGEYPSDPLVPLLRHGRRVAQGAPSPIPVNYFWAASNLQQIYDYNRLSPDPRLELARAELLLIVAGDPRWTAAVDSSSPFDRCRVADGLAAEFGRSAPVAQAPTGSDSMRAAVALLANARLRGCEQAGKREIDAPLRSEFVLLGAGVLGDSVGARAERWRLSLQGNGAAAGDDSVTNELAEAEGLARRLRPGMLARLLQRGDTTSRFLARWRGAVFTEVIDSLRARSAGDQLADAGVEPLADALLAAARLSGRRPSAVYPAAELHAYARRHGSSLPLTYPARVAAANHPAPVAAAVVALAAAALVAATWLHLAAWRRTLLLDARLYLDDAPGHDPFGGP
ncbi:MAG: hypothetical protein ACJ8GN_15950 [Longimicrobiaceae bacterium]